MVKNKLINQTYGVLLNKVSDGKIEFADIDFPDQSYEDTFLNEAEKYFLNSDDHANLAKIYERKGNYGDVIKHIDIIIKDDPKNGELYLKRGMCKVLFSGALGKQPVKSKSKINYLENAVKDFDKAEALGADNEIVYYHRGQTKFALRKYEEAIVDLEKGVELINESEKYKYYFGLSSCKTCIKDYKGAFEALDKAIEVSPGADDINVTIFCRRGYINNALGNDDEALSDFDKAIEINAEFPLVYYSRGLIKRTLEDYEGALEDVKKAHVIEPTNAKYANIVGVVYSELNLHDEALLYYNTAVDLAPEDANIITNRAASEYRLNKQPETISDCKKAIALDPTYDLAWYIYSQANYTTGNFKTALEAIEKAIELNPEIDKEHNMLNLIIEAKQGLNPWEIDYGEKYGKK